VVLRHKCTVPHSGLFFWRRRGGVQIAQYFGSILVFIYIRKAVVADRHNYIAVITLSPTLLHPEHFREFEICKLLRSGIRIIISALHLRPKCPIAAWLLQFCPQNLPKRRQTQPREAEPQTTRFVACFVALTSTTLSHPLTFSPTTTTKLCLTLR